MRALQLAAPEQWNLIDIPEPAIHNADDVLLKVHRRRCLWNRHRGLLRQVPILLVSSDSRARVGR